MSMTAEAHHPATEDAVSNVLKWVLLIIAVLTFALMGWATSITYDRSPPQPDRFVAASGMPLFTGNDILAGKAGFQKADLMDYGSLYGMGSYYGQDYTAWALVRLATLTENNVARSRYGRPFSALAADEQASAAATMRSELQHVDLTGAQVIVPDTLAAAIRNVQAEIASSLNTANPSAGWTPAYSLSPQAARQTADFLIYSALTTVARRPGVDWSWTENWPYEPMVGNTPTTNTFIWT
jgi:nitric oxide reductase subunit B